MVVIDFLAQPDTVNGFLGVGPTALRRDRLVIFRVMIGRP